MDMVAVHTGSVSRGRLHPPDPPVVLAAAGRPGPQVGAERPRFDGVAVVQAGPCPRGESVTYMALDYDTPLLYYFRCHFPNGSGGAACGVAGPLIQVEGCQDAEYYHVTRG